MACPELLQLRRQELAAAGGVGADVARAGQRIGLQEAVVVVEPEQLHVHQLAGWIPTLRRCGRKHGRGNGDGQSDDGQKHAPPPTARGQGLV